MLQKNNITDYLTYCVLYMATILCNKYVLSSLGFQYPTIFQAWQTFVTVVLIHAFSGNVLQHVTLAEIIPWVPAMMLHVGSIYSGSIALSHLSVPTFLLSHGASDVILILCDRYLPVGAAHFCMPLKMSGLLLALWSSHYSSPIIDLTWIVIYTLFAGAYRTAAFWYSTPQWSYSCLSAIQRQYLNNVLGFVILFPTSLLLGHHQRMQDNFPHLGAQKFYVGCVLSGVLGWGVNFMWGKITTKFNSANMQMVQLAAKVITLLASMHLFPVTHTMLLWTAILLGVSGDITQIVGSMLEESVDHGHDMSDVLVGS